MDKLFTSNSNIYNKYNVLNILHTHGHIWLPSNNTLESIKRSRITYSVYVHASQSWCLYHFATTTVGTVTGKIILYRRLQNCTVSRKALTSPFCEVILDLIYFCNPCIILNFKTKYLYEYYEHRLKLHRHNIFQFSVFLSFWNDFISVTTSSCVLNMYSKKLDSLVVEEKYTYNSLYKPLTT